jgi:hypothetical protein
MQPAECCVDLNPASMGPHAAVPKSQRFTLTTLRWHVKLDGLFWE